jgi:hypothetical protein
MTGEDSSDPPVPIYAVRLDPVTIRLRIRYAPDAPQPLRAWFVAHRPLVAVNGGFFTSENRATALIVSDGTVYGTSYAGFGGMLAVAPDGRVWIQALRDEPYDPNIPLDQAIQSFPMLIYPGGVVASINDNGQRARRTVVAVDRAGRVLLIVCPTSAFSLQELATWLASSDMEIDRALNLDGGSSSGIFVNAGADSLADRLVCSAAFCDPDRISPTRRIMVFESLFRYSPRRRASPCIAKGFSPQG